MTPCITQLHLYLFSQSPHQTNNNTCLNFYDIYKLTSYIRSTKPTGYLLKPQTHSHQTVTGIVVALDRQEVVKEGYELSAVEALQQELKVQWDGWKLDIISVDLVIETIVIDTVVIITRR